MGMVISLAIALVFTPWLSKRLLVSDRVKDSATAHGASQRLQHGFERLLGPFLYGDGARKYRHRLYLGTALTNAVALPFVGCKRAVVKLQPFDNQSEVQIVLNMPEVPA